MNEWKLREIHWVSDDDWPFDHTDEAVETANVLAPKGFEWVRSISDEPGYHLVEWTGSVRSE